MNCKVYNDTVAGFVSLVGYRNVFGHWICTFVILSDIAE